MKTDDCMHFVTEGLALLRSTNQHEKVFALVVDRITRLTACRSCAIIVVDPSTEYLHIAISHGISHTFAKEYQRRLATGPIGRLLWTGAPLLIEDAAQSPERAAEVALEHPFASCVCVPMMVDDRALGFLHVDSASPRSFATEEIRMLQAFADFAALALHKSRQFEENLHLDTIDHETGLKKYPAFLDRLQETLARGEEVGEEVGLLLLDIDNYKHIALTYGADSAKHTLREVADEIRVSQRPMDVAGRYGFDECIVLRAHSSVDETMVYAEDLRKRIADRTYAGKGIQTSVSVGAAVFPLHGKTERDLLLAVREALYEAQRGGRNQVRLWTK